MKYVSHTATWETPQGEQNNKILNEVTELLNKEYGTPVFVREKEGPVESPQDRWINGPAVRVWVEIDTKLNRSTDKYFQAATQIDLRFQQDWENVVYDQHFNTQERHYKVKNGKVSDFSVDTLIANVKRWEQEQADAKVRGEESRKEAAVRKAQQDVRHAECAEVRKKLFEETQARLERDGFEIVDDNSKRRVEPEERIIIVQAGIKGTNRKFWIYVSESYTEVRVALKTENEFVGSYLKTLQNAGIV